MGEERKLEIKNKRRELLERLGDLIVSGSGSLQGDDRELNKTHSDLIGILYSHIRMCGREVEDEEFTRIEKHLTSILDSAERVIKKREEKENTCANVNVKTSCKEENEKSTE